MQLAEQRLCHVSAGVRAILSGWPCQTPYAVGAAQVSRRVIALLPDSGTKMRGIDLLSGGIDIARVRNLISRE